jgi:meso-butanediol dehydrogenase / (S,S)-butanediol dehydrogenase / diacetyl reductase
MQRGTSLRFNEKVVCVTGGGHGIGRAIALRLASEGASLIVSDIDAAAAQGVAAEIGATVDASIGEAIEHFGRLNVLINTAGGDWEEPADLEDISDELWLKKIDVNLIGIGRCIRAALPNLIAAGPGSNVVSIGSVNASVALSGYPYSSAKAGLEILTKMLAVRYGRHGLRFNLISPATIRTRTWKGHEDQLERLAHRYPLGRIGEPADVAAAAAFLASDDASWITGVNLPVDGGLLAGPVSPFASSTGGSTQPVEGTPPPRGADL